jgi:hypothetical protein
MTDLPRLELTEDINKKNDYIIFRHQYKGKKTTKKRIYKKKYGTKKNKGIFNIF